MTERRGVTRGVRAAGRAAAMIGGTLLLALTWHVLFFWLMGATEWLLVPWDTTTERPARGTLARSVNDFFEHAPGSYVPAVVVVGGSMALSAAGFVRRRESRAWLPALVAGCNAAFIVVDYACVYFLVWVVGGAPAAAADRLSPHLAGRVGYGAAARALVVVPVAGRRAAQ